MADLLHEMTHQVLPCLQVLLQSGYQDDITATEEIREKWCSFLGQEMEGMSMSNQVERKTCLMVCDWVILQSMQKIRCTVKPV